MNTLHEILNNSLIFALSADNLSESEFVVALVKMAAYIIPFFLIPAAFKAGMGAFGALTGMLSDKSRGFFDKQRKYRQGRYDYNKQRMKSGERFNNRGLNALTSRASTRNFGLGATGREAYQQKINNAGADFSKTAQGQALQHNDNALRALTYGSEAEARANMARDFGMNANEVNTSIAAVRAGGGFGRNRQVWAAQQLAATGTGYDDLRQVSRTIARVSNGNQSQAAAVAGNINSATKSVGRYDLAPGFGQLNGLAAAEMGGGATDAAYHEATVRAARGADPVTLLRGKPRQVEQLTQALADHADVHRRRSQDATLSQADRDASMDEFVQTVGQMDQLDQSKGYASPENQDHVNTLMNETNVQRDHLNNLMGTGPGTPATNVPTQQQAAVRARWSQVRATRMSRDPNDPNTI